jgi:Sugar (and other) transporter
MTPHLNTEAEIPPPPPNPLFQDDVANYDENTSFATNINSNNDQHIKCNDDNVHVASNSSTDETLNSNALLFNESSMFEATTTTNRKNINTSVITNNDWKQTLAGIAGNVLEWYDFAVFGYFGDVIGIVFFPPTSEDSTANAYLLFGAAFFVRPIGGICLGYIGDVYGRKNALIISIFCMAFPTFIMGCLPGYRVMGIGSIICLVIVRLLQGFSVGGQLMSSLVFTLEQNDPTKWGFYGSLVMASASL